MAFEEWLTAEKLDLLRRIDAAVARPAPVPQDRVLAEDPFEEPGGEAT